MGARQVSWQRYTSSSELGWSSNETHAAWYEDAYATRNANATWHGTSRYASRYGTTRNASWYGSSSWYDGWTSRNATSNGNGNASRNVQTSNVIKSTNICVFTI